MSGEEPQSEYLQRFDAMNARLEEITSSIGGLESAKTKGIALRIEYIEQCLVHVIAQIKDIHETLIDLNNHFVDTSAPEPTHQ